MRPIRLKSSREINMLEGPILSKIFAFVLPLMLTNLLQMCYSAADMIIVGLSDMEGAIGAIGTTGALINLILNVFAGFAIGTSVVVARNIGRGDRQATERSVHTSLLIGLISGSVCAALGLVICRPILASMGAEGHILDLATLYTNIYFAGAPFLALTNFEIAILRAKGDTRTSLYILASTGVINVLLNLFFVLVLRMSVDGVALATAISNAASMALLGIRLRNDEGWCRLSFRKLRIDRRAMFEIIRDGLPAGIQGALFSFSNMLIQSSVIGINNAVCPGGSDIIDGNAAAANLESLAYVAAASVSQASVTFTSQHFGAGKFRRMGRVMANCYLVTAMTALVSSALMVVFRMPLIGLYVSSDLAVRTAETRIFILVSTEVLCGFMEVGSGVLRGLGRPITSTTISLIGSCLLRMVWLWTIFRVSPTLETIYLSYPVSWGLTALTHLTVSLLVRRRHLRAGEEAAPAPTTAA